MILYDIEMYPLGTERVDKLVDSLAMAIQAEMTVFDLEESDLAYSPQFGAGTLRLYSGRCEVICSSCFCSEVTSEFGWHGCVRDDTVFECGSVIYYLFVDRFI